MLLRMSQAAIKEALKRITPDRFKVTPGRVECLECKVGVSTVVDGSRADIARRDRALADLALHVCWRGRTN